MLNKVKEFFGVGSIKKRIRNGKPTIIYSVQSLENLIKVVIPHFKEYPLLTQKQADFILFSMIVDLMNKKEHLTEEGVIKIISIRSSMNKGLSDSLKKAFPAAKQVDRPLIHSQNIKSPLWLVGFVDGEGTFHIKIVKNKNNTKNQVMLYFSVTQHSRDTDLMSHIKNYLNCGLLEKVSTRPNEVKFVIYKFEDIINKIIPLFDNNPLIGVKSLDFLDFRKVASLMVNKSHLTEEGYNEIISIKNGMNSKRKL